MSALFSYVGLVLLSTPLLSTARFSVQTQYLSLCVSDIALNASYCTTSCGFSSLDYFTLFGTSLGEALGVDCTLGNCSIL